MVRCCNGHLDRHFRLLLPASFHTAVGLAALHWRLPCGLPSYSLPSKPRHRPHPLVSRNHPGDSHCHNHRLRPRSPAARRRRPATSSPPSARSRGSILIRFGGFGPVARSIFPDEVLLRKQPDHPYAGYKDTGWQVLGEELRTLLTDAEVDSARRTTFNAFYTSSTVIRAMFQALSRLGVPENALVLEPGCGPGRFPYLAPEKMRFTISTLPAFHSPAP
jgi:hypothetical protein